MHLPGVFIYSFFYELHLNWKHSLQVSAHRDGKRHEVQFKCIDGHLVTICCKNGSRQLFVGTFHNTICFHLGILHLPVQIPLSERQKCFNLKIKIEIFLTTKQLRKHLRVRLERLLFGCLVLRQCAGSKLCKSQTRQRVTTEVYNMLLSILGPLLLAGSCKCSRLA